MQLGVSTHHYPFNLKSFILIICKSFIKCFRQGAAWSSSHPCDLWDPCGVTGSWTKAFVVDGVTAGTLAQRCDSGRKMK